MLDVEFSKILRISNVLIDEMHRFSSEKVQFAFERNPMTSEKTNYYITNRNEKLGICVMLACVRESRVLFGGREKTQQKEEEKEA